PNRGSALAEEGRIAGADRAGLARSRAQASLSQGRRQAARGFHRHDRPLRRSDRLHQGALPVAAALFHRLSGGNETARRLEDRLEILSLRSARVIVSKPPATIILPSDTPHLLIVLRLLLISYDILMT